MSGVDNRIVTMQFNNRDFEQNARTSMTTLQKLKENMNFGSLASGSVRALGAVGSALDKLGKVTPFNGLVSMAQKSFGTVGGIIEKVGLKNPFSNATQGASDLQRAAQTAAGPAGMGALEGGVTAVSNKFIALSTIAITALSNITNRAINASTSWLKSFTVAPIMDGLREYQTTLQSIQTVQANTDQPLPKIEKALKDLNDYSDTTIYNFGEMAKNVGTFTAAGVNLEDSVASIRGIANVAALSGSNSQQAAGAMYQLSQAIAAGKVGAQDWNSVVNAGMAGKKLQTALAETAVAMKVLNKNAVTTNKTTGALQINSESFKNSIMAKPGSESWLTSGVLVNTLATLDGRFSKAYQQSLLNEDGTRRFTDAQIKLNMQMERAKLAKKGVEFTPDQWKGLLQMANASTKAAQDVKTLGQVFDIAKETIGSGWSASFKSIFGNLKESKKLFTDMSQGLNDIIGTNALARNELLASWKRMGGRDTLIAGLKDAWKGFYAVIKAVGAGFRDIFPKKGAIDLLVMTKSFANLMKQLRPSKETLESIRSIAGGVFAIFGIGKQILGGVVTAFKTMFDSVGGGNGDFLAFGATIGENLIAFNNFLKESGLITAFFEGLGNVLSVPINLLKGLGTIITSIFGGFDSDAAEKIGDTVQGVGERLSGLQAVGLKIKAFFTSIGDFFGGFGEKIGTALLGIGDAVASAFTADTFGSTLDVINTTLLGGLVLMIRNFFNQGLKIDLTGGLFDGIKETLGSATEAFTNMQQNLKANILLKIALAIGAMALALLVLSTIDPASLTKALGAMAGGFGILIGAMATLLKVLGPAGIVQLYVVTTAMSKMAFSILLLAGALKVLASLKLGDMLRGITTLALTMKVLTKAMIPLAANSAGMAKASYSLILVGIALNILATALKIMATMSWEEIARGLATATGALVGIALAMRLMPKGIVLQAAGILILSTAMNALGIALKIFATMSWEEMSRGLAVLAGALAVIGVTMRLMPKTMLITAAGLVVVAGALVVLSGALKVMGSMGWDEIAKGMVVLAGAMTILAVGLNAIGVVGAIGAVGLLTAAKAMLFFLPVMLAFGAMSWKSIGKSMLIMVGIFTVLGVAATLAGVQILILGAGLLLLGAGVALLGAGVLAIATAFAIVAAAGSAGYQVLYGLLQGLIAAIPPALRAFGEGIVQFAVALGQGSPAIATAFGKILNNLLDQVIEAVPKMGRLATSILNTLLRVLANGGPRIVNTGLKLIGDLLAGIARNAPRISDKAADIIVNFTNGVARNLPRIIESGIKLIIAFVRGLAKGIRENDEEMGEAGADLGLAIIEGIATGIGSGLRTIKDAAVDAAKAALEAAMDFLKIGGPSKLFEQEVGRWIPEGMAGGVADGAPRVVEEVGMLGKLAVHKMSQVMQGVDDAFALNSDLNPTVTPVLDLTALMQEANKMSSILAVAPIQAGVSYQTAADISAMTSPPPDGENPGSDGAGGDQYNELNLHLHSPKPIDSVESYRAGKTLIGLAKEALK